MPPDKLPRVSVGLPVYNGERTLAAALATLVSQTYSDFELIISDNCSTDATEAICSEYARSDMRIKYMRQRANLGAERNFQFVLEQACGEYFFWASADDVRSPDFIEVNLAFLDANPEYVGSISPTRFENGDFDEIGMGDFSLDGDAENRFLKFFTTWHANGRFCSIYRRHVLGQNRNVGQRYLGCDWATVLENTLVGKMHRATSGWVVFGARGLSNSGNVFTLYRRHWYEWFFPFATLTSNALRMSSQFSLAGRTKLVLILLRLNLKAARVGLRRALTQPGPDQRRRGEPVE
jgi:glycosyltransferase involved in cell wall biosynthesis